MARFFAVACLSFVVNELLYAAALRWLPWHYVLSLALVLVLVAGLLVSTLPTWSFKNFKIPREAVLPLLLGAAAYAALLVTEPWAAIAAAGLIYVSLLPFSIRSYQRLKREAEEMRLPEPASGPEAEQG